MPKIKTLDDYKNANKKYCKTYYNKKKNNLNNLKDELTVLKQENNKIKQENALLIKELMDIKTKLDTDIDTDNDTDNDTESEDNINYNELYNEISTRTKKFNQVFVKDYERHMNPNLLKYQVLFIDNKNDETLDNKRFEWLKNIKNFLDEDDDYDNEYEEVIYHHPLF